MILKNIRVNNYRKFIETSLALTDDITLLAGANNSGKTSLIEFIGNIIGSNKQSFCMSDIPVKLSKVWVDSTYKIISEYFDEDKNKEETIKLIVDRLFGLEIINNQPEILIEPTSVKFTISYELADDIRNFADYIMDLDSANQSFYFEYLFEVTSISFGKALEENYEKLKSRYEKIQDETKDSNKIKLLKEKILATYAEGLMETCYYTDSKFENKIEMDSSHFRKLFNYKNIIAGRPLDDQSSGNYKSISKNMIQIANYDQNWKSELEKLPDLILQPIEEAEITGIVHKISEAGIKEAINTIAEANGGNTGSMILDLDISEEIISDLINQITNTKYQFDDHILNESSQGLGYSNMIYIILQLEAYKKSIDPLLINIFFIEEPESHMHPQMQNVFGKYLRSYYMKEKIQGIITTHSSEIVRVTNMRNLRVARPSDFFSSKIYDFSSFKEKIEKDEVLNNFYNWFYEIAFSDIVFADVAVLYEGDTERMLIRKLSTFKEFQKLNQKYIAFIQVGGAYAHTYKELIEFLKIKTLILTDLDYDKEADNKDAVRNSSTTNATINTFYKSIHQENPKISDLYKWKNQKENILLNGLIYLGFQGEEDKFARTLEEAMLGKYYKIDIFVSKKRSEWCELRKEDKLVYTIPNSSESEPDPSFNIRKIVQHTSNSKTDFMYSVISENKLKSMLPQYIKEGLEWLMK